MGSDKKRKRRESDVGEDPSKDKDALLLSEKKKARKAAKAAAKAAAAAAETQDGLDSLSKSADTPSKGHEVGAEVDNVPPLVSPIASPMADKKLTRLVFGLVGSAAKSKALRRGIKEVVLALRKGDRGICVLAGDVFPVEVIAHLPLLCEEAGVPYCFVARKTDLGAAALTKRPTSVVLISEKGADKSLAEDVQECRKQLSEIHTVY